MSAGTQTCSLRLTVESFEQRFASPSSATAVIALRAELVRPGAEQVASRGFAWQRPSAPDAPGAARALARLADAAIGEVLDWAATRCQPGRTTSHVERRPQRIGPQEPAGMKPAQ